MTNGKVAKAEKRNEYGARLKPKHYKKWKFRKESSKLYYLI